MRAISPITALLVIAGTPATAGKPPSTGTMDPEVAYVRILPNGGREIRLAGADGTGSAVLATTRNRNISISLSPRSKNQLAYTDGNSLRLLTYEVTSTGPRTTSNVELVNFGRSAMAYVDYSPAGTDLVYQDSRDSAVYVHNLASGARKLVVPPTTYLADVKFNHDGSRVIYSDTVDTTLLTVQFRSVPSTGGTPTDLPIRGKYGNFHVGNADDRIVVDTMGDWDTGAITLFPADGGSSTRLATGYFPVLRCDTELLYQRRNLNPKGAVSILKLDLASNSTSTFSSADNMWADTYPDC